MIAYEDADGNTSGVAYDLLGRPLITSDGKGTQTTTYDPDSGVPVQVSDSAAGSFTASYDADGSLIEAGLSNGLAAQTTYDEAGVPVQMSYENTTNCSSSCTWLEFDVEESVHGQWLKQASTLSTQEYAYDDAGRLTQAKDTQGGECTTRSYAYDALARITSLPGAYSGGGTLTTSYFTNDLVRNQTQDGVTNTYELDATPQAALQYTERRAGRQRRLPLRRRHRRAGLDRQGSSWSRNVGASSATPDRAKRRGSAGCAESNGAQSSPPA